MAPGGSMSGRERAGSAIAMALALIAWTGCDSEDSAPDAGPNEVVIAALYPLSGPEASTGADIRRGLELAVDLVNEEHALDLPLARGRGLPGLGGARLRLVLADHGGQPDRAVTEARRLLASGDQVAFVGAYESSVTAEVTLVTEEAGVPFLVPDSSAPSITQRGLRWTFRTTATDQVFVDDFFTLLSELRTTRGIAPASAALVYENGLFGSSVATLERSAAQEAGLPLVAEVAYAADATSFDAVAREVQRSGAPIVLQSSFEQDAIGIMRAYEAIGYRPDAILAMDAGFISPTFVPTLGADANGVLSREVWAEDLGQKNALVRQVSDLFQRRYGEQMTGNSARALTGLLVLADAIDRAKSTDPERIRQALLATDIPASRLIVPWDGVRFAPVTGQNQLARGIIVQIQDGQYRTVWPAQLATADVVWPMGPWAP